jgi:hypothetical protein
MKIDSPICYIQALNEYAERTYIPKLSSYIDIITVNKRTSKIDEETEIVLNNGIKVWRNGVIMYSIVNELYSLRELRRYWPISWPISEEVMQDITQLNPTKFHTILDNSEE